MTPGLEGVGDMDRRVLQQFGFTIIRTEEQYNKVATLVSELGWCVESPMDRERLGQKGAR